MAAAIEFKLFDSNNKAATLLGSFSLWEEIPLEKDDRGYFRTKIKLEDRPKASRIQAPGFIPSQTQNPEIKNLYPMKLAPRIYRLL